MENKKFHLTITDNETSETLIDFDTNIIIGAADEGDGTREFSFVEGRFLDILATIVSIKNTLGDICSTHPELKAAEAFHEAFAKKETPETTEN